MSVGILHTQRSVLRGLTDARIATHSSATLAGYSKLSLVDGTLGHAWRSASSITRHAISFTLPAAQRVSFVGLFDVRVYGSAVVTQVACGRGLYGSPGSATLGSGSLRRRDAGMTFAAEESATWYIVVDLSAAATISIGEVVMGEPLVMATSFRDWTRDDQYATIRNGDYATRAASRRMHLSCEWAVLRRDDHLAMMGMIEPAEGELYPVIYVPDMDEPRELYHGTLSDDHPHSQGVNLYHAGHAIHFIESRRPLGS